MRASGDYFVTVIEDTRKNTIIGSATLVLEKKFIRNCAIVSVFSFNSLRHNLKFLLVFFQRGQLEDVVVDDTYRGKQLGKL